MITIDKLYFIHEKRQIHQNLIWFFHSVVLNLFIIKACVPLLCVAL